jgi:hypothetical protein
MRPLVNRCLVCSGEMEIAAKGRPRVYCSNACRSTARRRRREAAEEATLDGVTPDEYAGLDVRELLGPSAKDPDAAVLQTVLMARAVAAEFGVAAQIARRQFSWRCEAMANHIAEGLKTYFEPQEPS